MAQYITSDWHFGHNNICGKDSFVSTRTHFKNTEEMNEYLIETINSVVTNGDTLYHLGDFAMNLNPTQAFDIVKRLKGQLVLIKGNHDTTSTLKYFEENNYKLPDGRDKVIIHEVGYTFKQDKKRYYMTHYPLLLGSRRRKMRSFCGHIHEECAPDNNILNVGIDSPELPQGHRFGEPLLLEQAIELVEMKFRNRKEDV